MNILLLIPLIFAMVLSGCSGDNLTGSIAASTAPATVPCPTNSLLKTPCKVSQTDVVVTDAIGDDITQLSNQSSTSTTLNVPIPDGYYSNRRILVDEPALLATNIKSGVTIMGVTGTASGIAGNCTTNGLQSSDCTAATSTFWTSIAGANVTTWSNPGSSTIVSGAIPEGYYSSNTIAFTDANLVASKILTGTTIFGVTGSVVAAYSPCSDNAINVGACSTAMNRYVTATAGANVNGAAGSLSATIPLGYYDGTKTATMSDTNLLAANIKFGTTLFGVSGSLTSVYPTCVEDNGTINAAVCSTGATNRYISSVLGANITTGTNAGATTTVSAAIPDGYYHTKTVSFTDANLVATKIVSGNTIFGVSGSATAAYSACSDNALNASQCSTTASRYVTPTAGADVTVWTNTLANTTVTASLTDGFYSSKSCLLTDANLIAANIKSGTSVFGVTGTLNSIYSTCQEDNGTINGAICTTSTTNRYVSSVLGTNITSGTNGDATTTVSATIPDGYYKTKSVSFTDANLVAAKILNGTTIFGVTGSVVAAYGACTNDALNAGQCSTATNRYVSPTLGNDITVSGGTTALITLGFYDGTKSCNVSDANLTAANIKSGTTILGVAGSVVAAYAACTDDNYNAGQCSTAAARYVSPTLGSAISSWTNASSTTTVTGSIPGGFYPTAPLAISFTDANLVAANIISGKTIFNVAGLANIFVSNVHRDKATTQITQLAEATTYAGVSLPTGYRDIPDITKDDDGYQSAGVTSPQVTLSTRPGTNCGTTQTTIAARIADCASVIGANATWDGTVKGNAGQGVWKLVTRAAASKEVWQDQRTGLIWSSVLTTGDNWCRAAGNGQTTGNGYAANDPSTYCNNVTYQPNYVNNTTAFSVQSWCAESGPVTLVPAAGSGETWGATPTYATAKGGMGMTATASSPSVRWRLPTKYDYQQADNNGIRFVMPEMATTGSGYEWSASVVAGNRVNAWNFYGASGFVNNGNRTNNYSVRCIAR